MTRQLMQFRFTVPAVPVAQPRAKATAVNGRARMYTPTKIKSADGSKKQHPIAAFKATVRMAAMKAYSGPPMTGPLCVDCTFVFPREKSKEWKTRPMPRYRHIGKPDRDNCDKAILDALKGTILADDCIVCDGRIQKWRAAGDEQPHVEICVTKLDVTDCLAPPVDVSDLLPIGA